MVKVNLKLIGLLLLILFCSCLPEVSHSDKLFNEFTDSSNSALSLQEVNSSNNVSSHNPLNIMSWNIRDLGRTKNAEEIHQIAQILRRSDLVAIQEVVAKDPAGAQAVAKIADELNRMGSKWDYTISNPTKSPSSHISERYAFLWKTHRVKMLNEPYLASKFENEMYREPYIANFKFKDKDQPISIVNFHSRKYYDKPEEEIIHFTSLVKTLSHEAVVIVGDFNLTEKHRVWNSLYEIGFQNALSNTKTTLKQKCHFGQYRNHAIDNVYYNEYLIKINAQAIDLVKTCKNLKFVRELSDHLPVMFTFQ
ncbi:endonuclease/exonuclease/phosphatase family protein [Mangrovimonas cancribranchiae]|uniref:Endonuclease/exonuclease/phosphatase family protein n=1 Tax=Mangrovimonas cancribranchiae TaxID=3080055 RepID=A0AAU6P0P0_9FLAO